MGKKADISPLVIEIIGGVIVTAVMMTIFASFASPYLAFLIDQQNIESFNRFTSVQASSCKEGVATEFYFSLSAPSLRRTYDIVFISPETVDELTNENYGLTSCQGDTTNPDTTPCMPEGSKTKLDNCRGTFCWCLFKIDYKQKKEGESFSEWCAPHGFNTIVMPMTGTSEQKLNSMKGWGTFIGQELKKEFVKKTTVLQCTKIREQMGCTKDQIPVLPTVASQGIKNYVVFMQADITKKDYNIIGIKTTFKLPIKLYYESMSMERPLVTEEKQQVFDNYLVMYTPTKPRLAFWGSGTSTLLKEDYCTMYKATSLIGGPALVI